MESLYTAMTGIPPSLRLWSKHPENRCAPDEIPVYWETHDALTFLAGVGMYDIARYHTLDADEKEQHRKFKSEYFKKRFTVSRSLLRQILPRIPGTENNADIVMTREKNGRIQINTRPDIFISLSYSGSCIAVTLGKRKIGSDIEIVTPQKIRKIRIRRIPDSLACGSGKNPDLHPVHVWTLLEAYAKFHDMSLYPLTQDRFFLPDAHFVSYCIDRRTILSLAYDGNPLKDTLLWIDPGCGSASCRGENTTAGSSPRIYGAPHVRA
jgi:4'-phosphopantetheinyl transferase